MATTSKRSLVSRASAAARKVVTKKAAPAKVVTKKAAPAKASTTKAAPAKAVAKKAASAKAPASKTAPAKKTSAAKKAAPAKATAKKVTPARATAKKVATRRTAASRLVVLDSEEPWTTEELTEVRTALKQDVARLTAQLGEAEVDLLGLMSGTGEGAGNDQADVGSATFERDQEMTIVNNARDMLAQSEHALGRIFDGSYGVCENCGNPIGKNRLMAFPRATMCLTCKQREERR